MKNCKRILLAILTVFMSITLFSCKKETTSRNTVVPYEGIDLAATVAESGKGYTLTNADYYSRLRATAYNTVTEEMEKIIYSKEISAITNTLKSSFAELSDEDKKTLAYNNDGESNTIDEERFNELKKIYSNNISSTILNSIFSSSDSYTVNSKTDDEVKTAITKYIESNARNGYDIVAEDISYSDNDNDDVLEIDLSKLPSDLLASYVLTEAEKLYAEKQLYKIADEELLNEGTDEEEENKNYLFDEDKIESTYNSSYKTFGTYNAIIITFNSRRDALKTIDEVLAGTEITNENVLEMYLALYNKYYSCYGTQNENSDLFEYNVTLEENELDDISDDVNTLITETLKDGEFLTEPRNLNNKYVLAYRISTTYTYGEKDFADLDEATKADLTNKIKNNLVKANASSYTSTAFKAAIENSDLEIYDPLFEYKFRNSYTDQYELISTDNSNIGKNLIFKLNDSELTVKDFYTIATKKHGATIVTDYFMYNYALEYKDDFITEETENSNKETLASEIEKFEKNENETYPVEVGLETYLLNAYGYPTEELVLKYYHNATTCLTNYKNKVLFDEWATDDHNISDDATKVLDRILKIGNENYKDMFSMDVDHILINIDYNADGTPDDPDKFISEHPEIETSFNEEVTALMTAIYKEAIHEDYEDNALFDTLSYIVKQFNKGDVELRSQPGITWDYYKTKFNFLLKAEKLASSGDITQDSVSNFVVPFADYLKAMYENAATNKVELDDNGNFFLADEGKIDTIEDADKITASSICKTVYGYHLIVLNEYIDEDSEKYFTYTADDDKIGSHKDLEVLISEDDENSENNVYVVLDAYNDEKDATEANMNQLFVYYVQKKTGETSTLSSDIESLMSTLFNDAIEVYGSSNFQNMILIDLLDITSSNEVISKSVKVNRNYYANLVTDYDDESDYITWVDVNMDWTRPNQK